ncbi:MAG: hypothetical protein NC421_06710 [Lachnospiraceae bacterium]|nr:hypothetical protein [Lachnospiraceae bacterium]
MKIRWYQLLFVPSNKAEVQIKPDPKDGNQFHLCINGKNIFQWFKDLRKSLRQTINQESAVNNSARREKSSFAGLILAPIL